jgi:hypothetical protein
MTHTPTRDTSKRGEEDEREVRRRTTTKDEQNGRVFLLGSIQHARDITVLPREKLESGR